MFLFLFLLFVLEWLKIGGKFLLVVVDVVLNNSIAII